MLVGNLSLFFALLYSQLIIIIKKIKNSCLENIDLELVLLVTQVSGLKKNRSMVVNPHDFTIGELVHIKLAEDRLYRGQLRRNVANGHILEWPMAAGQDLCFELNFIYEAITAQFGVFEFLNYDLGFDDVGEHSLHLAYSVVAHFDLKALDHPLLG